MIPEQCCAAGLREGVARSLACEEHCVAEVHDALGIPRDPDRCGQGPRSRVRRSKPDAVSRMVALGVVESNRGAVQWWYLSEHVRDA